MDSKIKGLIFDCDGTLADSMPLHFIAWQKIAQKYGFQFPKDKFYSMGGVPSHQIVEILAHEQGLVLHAETISAEKEKLYLQQLPQILPIEPVVAIARANRGKIPLAVATGGNHFIMQKVLGHLGMLDWFQAIVTSEDVVHGKPAPDVFLEAARRVGVPPESCRAYEDTDLGLQAIRSAGMEPVDVRIMLGQRVVQHGS
jgi:HAD superfamily hydrolase (TIGR01509 family)